MDDPAGAHAPDDVEHVHVEAAVVGGTTASRALFVQLLGRAPTSPTRVFTGCGLHRPLAATSTTPERVTCWTCRQHAGAVHQRTAEQLRALAGMLALSPAIDDAVLDAQRSDAARHEDLAARYRR